MLIYRILIKNYLLLIFILANVALGKSASQSSDYAASQGASVAVDGLLGPDNTHTGNVLYNQLIMRVDFL